MNYMPTIKRNTHNNKKEIVFNDHIPAQQKP